MQPTLIKIGEAAKRLGVAPATLRAWDKAAKLVPVKQGKHRYYLLSEIQTLQGIGRIDRTTEILRVIAISFPDITKEEAESVTMALTEWRINVLKSSSKPNGTATSPLGQ